MSCLKRKHRPAVSPRAAHSRKRNRVVAARHRQVPTHGRWRSERSRWPPTEKIVSRTLPSLKGVPVGPGTWNVSIYFVAYIKLNFNQKESCAATTFLPAQPARGTHNRNASTQTSRASAHRDQTRLPAAISSRSGLPDTAVISSSKRHGSAPCQTASCVFVDYAEFLARRSPHRLRESAKQIPASITPPRSHRPGSDARV